VTQQHCPWLLADRSVWSFFVAVLAPILHIFPGIRKAQKPVRVGHSAGKRLLDASMNALSAGFPGRLTSCVTPRWQGPQIQVA